jgi:HD-GYP domain-containing protein (c-di-GMP phosphodiesterase class II)
LKHANHHIQKQPKRNPRKEKPTVIIDSKKMINILRETLNYVDPRLIDHGQRVAYLAFRVLSHQGKYTDEEIQDICILAMLHDIGAYRTEEIDKMVVFETTDIWEHSVYGYLVLKYFSPLKKLAPVILFHHADCKDAANLPTEHRQLAQLISLCDRADVFLVHGLDISGFYRYIEAQRDVKFESEVVDAMLAADIDFEHLAQCIASDIKFHNVFYETVLTEEEINGYVNMVVFSIDFRSSQTVIHTITVTAIAGILARLAGLTQEMVDRVITGATLHDIGKIGVPVSILESENRLNEAEMAVMRSHIDNTEKILKGNVDDDILYMAVNHHEKLNGTGYPKGLRQAQIAREDRIMAVADILSALCYARSYKEAFAKEKVLGILTDMGEHDLVDPNIVAIAARHYDEILAETDKLSAPAIANYEAIRQDYKKARELIVFNDLSGLVKAI